VGEHGATFGTLDFMIITIIDRSKGKLTKSEVSRAASAVNTQVKRDFAPFWGTSSKIKVADSLGNASDYPMQDNCVIYLQKEVDVDDALGYHATNNEGIPFGVVFTDLSEKLGEPWTVTLSHEVLELIGDPQANLTAIGPHPEKKSQVVFHWFEMCDAVQSQTYSINGVEVSNFVLPFYFTPGAQSGRNDFLNTQLPSFGVNPGGYIGFYDPVAGKDASFTRDRRADRRFFIKGELKEARRAARYHAAIGGPLQPPVQRGKLLNFPAFDTSAASAGE
jgi:hypothetical protein